MAFLTIHIITCEENEIPDFLNLTHARDIKKIEQQLFRLPAYIKRISDLCRDMVPFMWKLMEKENGENQKIITCHDQPDDLYYTFYLLLPLPQLWIIILYFTWLFYVRIKNLILTVCGFRIRSSITIEIDNYKVHEPKI